MAFANGYTDKRSRIVFQMTISEDLGIFTTTTTEERFTSLMNHAKDCPNHDDLHWAILSDDNGVMVQMWKRLDNGLFQMQTSRAI
jgi:hypothetical protein